MIGLNPEEIKSAVAKAMEEDLGEGDATSLATIPAGSRIAARMVAREPLILAGLDFARSAFQFADATVEIVGCGVDGQRYAKGESVLEVRGPARAVLGAERVALNFVQHLSGVATATCRYVDAVAHTKTKILDTRKTFPGWRRFQKYAVACGGGTNHRLGLWDMILIKDNHLAAVAGAKPNAIAAAIAAARNAFPQLKVEVEADSLEQVHQAAEAGADIILLDNMSLDQMREAVRIVGNRAQTEASGGITLDTVKSIAETGVDFISVGALTHSVKAVDLGLDFVA